MRVFLSLIAAALFSAPAVAATGPQPPCGRAPEPAYAAPGQAPAQRLWSESELAAERWSPPACLGWAGPTRLVGAIAAEFIYPGRLDDLLGRIGAVSHFPQVRYWSASRQVWRPLASDAAVLQAGSRRADLGASDMVSGAGYDYFESGDAGRTSYRFTVRERSADRVVVTTENTSAVSLLVLPLFDARALQSAIFLERAGEGRWRYYQVIRAGAGTGDLALKAPASYVNRLLALYGFVIGSPAESNGWRER